MLEGEIVQHVLRATLLYTTARRNSAIIARRQNGVANDGAPGILQNQLRLPIAVVSLQLVVVLESAVATYVTGSCQVL